MNEILSFQQMPASTSSTNQHVRDVGSSSSGSSSSSVANQGGNIHSFLSFFCG